ncbi:MULTISPECIES: tetratricopeptide repeat protein [Aerosakkonema]|uniref:tetratricopeptide repeat protein n=1 Tax=Aerosakkonema TaxID=1246629 RepID=UPI0035B7E890
MQATEEKVSWYDVPADIKQLLVLAAENWENSAESEEYMNQALAKTGNNTDVLVAAYRYFFYKNNQPMALVMATKVVENVKESEKLPNDWSELKPILETRKNEPEIRLYLNAYAASGFVLAKLGKIEKALEVMSRIKEIDDRNEFGAKTIFEILTRPPEED